MNFKLSKYIFVTFFLVASALKLEETMSGDYDLMNYGGPSLSIPNKKAFDENREQILEVVKEQLQNVSGYLVGLSDHFDVDLNGILEPFGFAVDTTYTKRNLNLQRRDFLSFLKDIINSSLLAVGAIATVITVFQPEFAPVAAAAFAIHKYINRDGCTGELCM